MAKAQYSEEKKAYDNRTPEEIEAANEAAAAALLVRLASLAIHTVDINFGRFISLKRQTLSLVALSLREPRPLLTIKSRRVRRPLQTRSRRIVAPPKMMIRRKRYHHLSNPPRMTAIPIAKQTSRPRPRRNGEVPPRSRKAKKAQKHDRMTFLFHFLFYRLI